LSRKISSVNDDLEQENRRARVLSLNSRGLAQSEIAQHVNVTQQKVSADLKHIREASRKVIEDAARKASFVYANYFAGMNQIKKEL
jgi:transcriptional regulator